MRTGRSLTVCRSLLRGGVCSRGWGWGGGDCSGGGVCSRGVSASWGGVSAPRGVSALGGCLLWGMSALGRGCLLRGGGGIPACTEADTPLWTESQTPVKTLTWPNFVAAGNKVFAGLFSCQVYWCFKTYFEEQFSENIALI